MCLRKYLGGSTQQQAFDELKRLLCKATTEPLYVVDFSKPFNLFVDASGFATSAILTQTGPNGIELPVRYRSANMANSAIHPLGVGK